jgi:Flp pilus assembly protein TadG
MIRRWLARRSKAGTAVEFAIVGWMLCMVTFAIVETGLLYWLKGGLQVVASMTARCGAISTASSNANNLTNFACTDLTNTQNYAVNTVGRIWLVPNMLTPENVVLNGTGGKVTSCNGFTGNFYQVSLSSGFFAILPPPLGNYATVSANACYPMP